MRPWVIAGLWFAAAALCYMAAGQDELLPGGRLFVRAHAIALLLPDAGVADAPPEAQTIARVACLAPV